MDSATISSEKEYFKVAEVPAGKIFGELALLSRSAKRAATVIAMKDCHMATLDRNSFELIKKKHEDHIGAKIKHIRQIPFLARISQSKLAVHQANFKEHKYIRGQALAKEGAPLTHLHLVIEGEFECVQTHTDHHHCDGMHKFDMREFLPHTKHTYNNHRKTPFFMK